MEREVPERTALMNQMRGLPAECGSAIAQGAARLRRALAAIAQAGGERISGWLRELLSEMGERPHLLEERPGCCERRMAEFARTDERAGRLMKAAGAT
jgi:hypothetical protein